MLAGGNGVGCCSFAAAAERVPCNQEAGLRGSRTLVERRTVDYPCLGERRE